ncbi:twin-arginine translocation signal domain-containing protein [Streptomyces avidinii]|uniref:twin-arginine translocation signal domain-containing protein n=1 Tax=Streptomyces avidinii TaxID=1895 RepID=UPI00379139A5
MQNAMTRRSVVKGAAALGVAAGLGTLVPGTAAAAPKSGQEEPKKLPTSANGWTIEKEANHVSTVWTRPVAGTGLQVDVRIGDVEAILVHVIRRFHYEVEQISRVDLVGWREIGGLRKDRPESNLASGTAVRIRPGASAKGGFFAPQELVLRDILADCEGVVRWGGDDKRVDESLFYIDCGPADERVRKTADKLRAWEEMPGAGAGVEVDVLAQPRRTRAERLAGAQRSA